MSAILAIEQASFPHDAYPESLFRLYAADPHTLFQVAETMDGLVGYIIVRMDRWGAEIVSLAVDPGSRNLGIGGALLGAAVRRMARQNARSIRLMVHANNTRAWEFYRKQGFRSVGRVSGYYDDGGTAIRMRLLLNTTPTRPSSRNQRPARPIRLPRRN